MSVLLALVLAAPSADPPTADTEARSVAVLPLQIDGSLPEGWQETIAARLVMGMHRAGLSFVPPEEHGVRSCATEACVQGLGESAGVDFVVSSRLRVEAEGRSYALAIRVSSARSGKELAALAGSCDLCGFEEAADLVEAKAGAVSDLLEKIVLGNPVVRFTSSPAGVALEIDGAAVGQTPLSVELEPGSHRVRATLPGFMPQTFEIESVEGVSKELEFQMMPEPRRVGQDAPARQPGRGLVIAGAVLTGVGVAAIAAGAALLAIHHRPYRSRCEADEEGDCRFLYGTQTGGIVTVAIGGAAVIGGVGLLVGGAMARKKRPVAMSFGVGSVGVSF